MLNLQTLRWIGNALLVSIPFIFGSARAADQAAEIRLFALDCGYFEVKDAALFSNTFEYDGKPHAGMFPASSSNIPRVRSCGTPAWGTGWRRKLAE